MSPITEERIRTALASATERVVAPPDLAERVTAARSRPRAARRGRGGRATLVLVPIAVVAVVALGVLVAPRFGDGPTTPAADEALLHRPTGGDLADDEAVTAEALTAFRASVRPDSYRSPDLATPPPGARGDGDPRVLWAGTTGTGPAAIVAQRESTARTLEVAVGFLGTVRGTLTVAAVGRRSDGYADLAGALVGTGSRTLLVLDRGEPVRYSFSHTYVSGGGIELNDRPVTFTDGAAAIDLPPSASPAQVRLTRPGAPNRDRALPLGAWPGDPAMGRRLDWWGPKTDPDGALFPVGDRADAWPEPDGAGRYGQLLRAFRDAIDTVPTDVSLYGSAGDDAWYAWGATPDGRRLVATDLAADGDPSRAYVVLLADDRPPTVVDGGPIDLAASVPFRVRLPDGQGWLVAAAGKALSWTTGTGSWTAAGPDAALLPATATAVRVAGGTAIPLA